MQFQQAGSVNILLHWIGVLFLRILGWKVEGAPPEVPKYVVIVAPHTSNWDYPIILAISWYYRMKGAWLGKSEIFTWPLLGWFFRRTGGIPVDRNESMGFVDQAVGTFKKRDRLVLAITPEGTRAKRNFWKSGFYRVAVAAQVPIALGYIDFKRKVGGFGPLYQPTGNAETDIAYMRAFFDTINPRHPSRRSEIRFRNR